MRLSHSSIQPFPLFRPGIPRQALFQARDSQAETKLQKDQALSPIATQPEQLFCRAIQSIKPAGRIRFGERDSTGKPYLAIAPGYEDQYHQAIRNEKAGVLPYAAYLPSILEETESGKKMMMDLPSRLFANNYVFVSGPVTGAMADAIKMQFTYLANKMMNEKGNIVPEKVTPIKMIINSPGGEILAMDQILDAMNDVKKSGIPVETYVGFAASAATLIASNGTFGRRFISPKARFMIHQPLGGARGQATEIAINNRLIQQMKQELIDHLTERIIGKENKDCDKKSEAYKKMRTQVKRDVERDKWMKGHEVVDYGLADAVISGYNSAASAENSL